ncbi:DUF2938 domain-containing protein [Acidisoma silvae]|uniref:DUF2938 domain-containing protein n=1 Tax=Acidisoma silvae TaxID=2802396 RepID=UPI001D0B22B7|nr:DUF2938 domain-containing protein [Acidisoma silvae]
MIDLLWRGLLIGIGATILMDIWAFILAAFPGQSRPNWRPVGRWVGHLGNGRVFHDDIAAAAPFALENSMGWVFHYVVGALYGAILVALTGPGWLVHPTFWPAWIWGIVTIAGGWFLLVPGLGLGWAASRTPNPNRVRIMGLIAHTVFGFGLYATALLIR